MFARCGDHPSAGQWTWVLTGCSDVSEMLPVDHFCELLFCLASLPVLASFQHPCPHPTLLTGRFTDAADCSSVWGIPSESISSYRAPPVAFQGPGSQSPCCVLVCLCYWASFAAIKLGTRIPSGSPWGTICRT